MRYANSNIENRGGRVGSQDLSLKTKPCASYHSRPRSKHALTAQLCDSLPLQTEVQNGDGHTLIDHGTPGDMEKVVLEVRKAISQGVHPKLIVQGSSGSYFVSNCAGQVGLL